MAYVRDGGGGGGVNRAAPPGAAGPARGAASGGPRQGQEQGHRRARHAPAPAGNSFEALWAAYRRADRRATTSGAEGAARDPQAAHRAEHPEPGAGRRWPGWPGPRALRWRRARRAPKRTSGAPWPSIPTCPTPTSALALARLKQGLSGCAAGGEAHAGRLDGAAAHLARQHYLSACCCRRCCWRCCATIGVLAFALAPAPRRAAAARPRGGAGRGQPEAIRHRRLVALLLLPVLTFQGWAWLPLWWLALLFLYMRPVEKAVVRRGAAGDLPCGRRSPRSRRARSRRRTRSSAPRPRRWKAGPTRAPPRCSRRRCAQNPDDRDLVYLLALQYRKAGRYDDAAALYRDAAADRQPKDSLALNNLANIEFARGEFQAAIARYKQGIESGASRRDVAATFYYNLSLAHLQRFEYQPATEARSQADRLASGLIADVRPAVEVRQGRLRGGGPGAQPGPALGQVRGRARGRRA